jgi:hypothetical protein
MTRPSIQVIYLKVISNEGMKSREGDSLCLNPLE